MSDNSPFELLDGWRVAELLWPLNDMFRARLHQIRSLPYDPVYEAEADAAIVAYANASEQAAWKSLSPQGWRVLLERLQQLLTVAVAKAAAGQPFKVPSGFSTLSEADQLTGLMLLWLLRMKLPFPLADRSRLELPSTPPSPQARGH